MVNIKKEVDEVWLAIDQAIFTLRRDGHNPSESQLDCQGCYTLHLLKNAADVYLKSRRIVDVKDE